MSDPDASMSQAARDAATLRAMYERYSFMIVPAVVVLVIMVLIAACLIDTKYGQDVIDRVLKVSGTIMEFIGILLGGTGLTMTRGHMDQRINGDH